MKVSGAGMGNSLAGLTYYSNNKDDPYITLKEEVHYILLLIPCSGRKDICKPTSNICNFECISKYDQKAVWIEKYMLVVIFADAFQIAKLKYS